MTILNIVETAYRATLEEQDDTIVWLSAALKNSGADLDVLFRGNAVNYLVPQECSPLKFGNAGVNHPPRLNEDVRRLQSKGVKVFVVSQDLDARGIDKSVCIEGVHMIQSNEVAALLDDYEQVWHW